jgi:hypothetical protein
VFAPHYAAPVSVTLNRDAVLRSGPEPESEEMARLSAGAGFELLDRSGGQAWGIASAERLVGYLDEAALGDIAAAA